MGKCTADEMIKVAESYVGYIEKNSNKDLDHFTKNGGTGNYTKFGKWYGENFGVGNPNPWCAFFMSYCLYEACGDVKSAKSMLGGTLYSSCSVGATAFKKAGIYHKTNPKKGDLIFFWNGIRQYHTGLVYKVENGRVYTIEGNTSGAQGVVANGGCVAKKSYPLNYAKIDGYASPKYATSSKTNTTTSSKKESCPYKKPSETVKKGSPANDVKWVQWHLTKLGYKLPKYGVDGGWGEETEKAVTKFQDDQEGWSPTSKAGSKTIARLEKLYKEQK